MSFLFCKPIFLAALSFPALNNRPPEITDLAFLERHVSALHHISKIIRHPNMINSIQKICKEKLPKEFIKLMQTPLPTDKQIKLCFYPEALEVIEYKRHYDGTKCQEIQNSIENLFKQEGLNLKNYDHCYDNQVQQELNLTLKEQIYQGLELKRYPLIYHDSSFRALLISMLIFIDLSRLVNSEGKDFHYAFFLSDFVESFNYLFTTLIRINNDSEEKLSFTETKDLLMFLVESFLSEINYLNQRLDTFNANCKCTEHHVILNGYRRTNAFAEKMFSCFASLE